MKNSIKCSNCGHVVDMTEAMQAQINAMVETQLEESLREKDELHNKEIQKITDQKNQEFSKAKEKIETELKEKIQNENSLQFQRMQKELDEKSSQLQEMNALKAELISTKRKAEEEKSKVLFEAEHKFHKQIEDEKTKIKERLDNEHKLQFAERDKLIDDLKVQLSEAKRKAEQGSMQLQGEVQEIEIEDFLKEQYPLDTVDEVKKGARGADCIQIINTRESLSVGKIYYESKRTKEFKPEWIGKFKQDMREKGVDIGILITAAMPKDMPKMGLKDGVWICKLKDLKTLSFILRHHVIEKSKAIANNENRGDKMNMLYTFLTSNEFKMQVEAIIEGFTDMKSDLESEKRSMQRIWKTREKQIEKVIANTIDMHSCIRGIAGNSVLSIPLLELDSDE